MWEFDFSAFQSWLEQHPETRLWLSLGLLLLVAWLSNFIVKKVLIRGIFRALRASVYGQHQVIQHSAFIARLANIVPALIISKGITLIDGVSETVSTIVVNVCNAFVVLTIALAIANILTLINAIYEQGPDAKTKPIKGYVQVLKIVVFTIALILMIAALVDRSPLILLSGLGAMAAVLMLIFQDTILSLVASVQISSNDVIRVGDWVEMPQLNADGDVIDIALHTVKVQNWDKTITTIPTRRFMTDAFKNWRGMQQSGGRRIKRSLMLDQQSVHFLDADERKHLTRFSLLQDYLSEKQKEIDSWNSELAERGQEPVNTRRITNIGTFRAYVQRYLASHPGVHQHMTLMARQLAPGADGLPLEIYCFTNTTAWLAYEGIQSDIFDHLLAILPEFGLRVYQHPSGMDIRAIQLSRQDD
ncbi:MULTISPECIES: mechanosensitive ion channel family protein [unclassified Arsukibacterium]|uniref:mechanosensitive ion channel family protein n=1 Tax=unclassified Arsukibacterium TaxID=2635278 RepID=UPI000C66AD19|nr:MULTISPECIES: mechanosensitive ion channel family protein [unclassified Arsukibacterium]MAA94571.1 mechanosensitive ion channel protein MscS [Rheinheimera sp.]MBM32846.1 mechanosensitive ion channel protein MscS [Rheinheimera sp.]|tara:strand:+ start:27474 stop:28724 length:1251 start_codon:yes stop_codon:yes gene_type:complete